MVGVFVVFVAYPILTFEHEYWGEFTRKKQLKLNCVSDFNWKRKMSYLIELQMVVNQMVKCVFISLSLDCPRVSSGCCCCFFSLFFLDLQWHLLPISHHLHSNNNEREKQNAIESDLYSRKTIFKL